MRDWRAMIAGAGLGLFATLAFGADIPSSTEPTNFPEPGALNYVEGSAYVDGSQVGDRSVGSVRLKPGDELTTGAGKAEILLTPGIFLRVDSNSAVKMISPDLEQTQVQLERGRAGVEVDQIFPQNMVQIIDNGVTTQLLRTGYYEFATDPAEALVFDGRAEVALSDGKWETVKDHHEVALAEGVREKTQDFNSHPTNDGLYNWSSLRSHYLAEANNQMAGEYANEAGFYPGWYWDPWTWDYTYLGWDPFFSPFGWGFYPWGFYGGGFYGGGFYGGQYYHHGSYGPGPVRNRGDGHGSYSGGFQGGNAGGGRAFAGGGFHDGGMGGGFHGGGGGFGGGRR
jgi:hypothetical protein